MRDERQLAALELLAEEQAAFQTDFAKQRWTELRLQASIGAPILVDGEVWGVVMASHTEVERPFPRGAENQLRDFAALVAQAIVNAEARRETAELIAEQTSLGTSQCSSPPAARRRRCSTRSPRRPARSFVPPR